MISQFFYKLPYMEVMALSADSASLNFTSKISEKEVNTCLCCKELRVVESQSAFLEFWQNLFHPIYQ